ncbi:endolytic transglycosylase MltG [Patescibacteria group bacterium]|nr:endolytic transglycosylase MltG [Patescibacteria group bacterium]
MLRSRAFIRTITALAVAGAFFIALPQIVVRLEEVPHTLTPFPVSVDPKRETIADHVPRSAEFVAAAVLAGTDAVRIVGSVIAESPLYAYVSPLPEPVSVRLVPGLRAEEVAERVASSLGWDRAERYAFLEEAVRREGRLYPSRYLFEKDATPSEVLRVLDARFNARMGARYASSTEAIVPMQDALTIASLIEREAGNETEMRIISGVLWNRLFADQRLEIDATLSYARGSEKRWWPVPRPRDKFVQSPYNTYRHAGLPPGPIASPSIAAVYAALNPEVTNCYFYFHSKGSFYCSPTYAEHVAKLTELYGRGR